MSIKYNFTEDIFENIDSPEKAYWLGFLYADGYITTNGHSIAIALKEADKEHLLNFEKFLNLSESSLRYQEDTSSWIFRVTREKTYKDLINLGFSPNKSYDTSITVWQNIPNKYKKDFLLGLWDGDGSFYFSADEKQIAGLVSNNDMLISTIADYINNNLEKDFCKVKPRTQGDPYPRIRFWTNKAKIFGDWLYSGVTYPVLKRKYEIYLKMGIREKAHYGWDNIKTKGILCIESNKIYTTAKECCKEEFGIDNAGAINNIRAVCRKERKQTRGKHFRYLTEEERQKIVNGELNF